MSAFPTTAAAVWTDAYEAMARHERALARLDVAINAQAQLGNTSVVARLMARRHQMREALAYFERAAERLAWLLGGPDQDGGIH